MQSLLHELAWLPLYGPLYQIPGQIFVIYTTKPSQVLYWGHFRDRIVCSLYPGDRYIRGVSYIYGDRYNRVHVR